MSYVEQSFVANAPCPQSRAGLRRDFVLPLATIAALVSLALVSGVHFGVTALNEESAAREMQLVRNGLDLRAREVAELVVPQTDWDDAVRNLDNRYNLAWAASNINEFLDHAWGFDGEVVLDARDMPMFVAWHGEIADIREYPRIAKASASLVESVRRDEVLRGPLQRHSDNPDLMSRAIQAGDLKTIDGKLTILTATLVQPDFGTAMPSGPRAPIVLTAMQVDKPFLTQFSKRFLLEDVDMRFPGQAAQAGRIEVPVRDNAGTTQAWLTWQPLDPGYGMLHRMALPFSGALLVLLAIAAFQLRRIFRAARDLIAETEMPELFFWDAGEKEIAEME
jgi:sensor domain CHASE-containing protein